MKAKFSKKDFQRIYDWTSKDSPLSSEYDCGKLCGSICCADTDSYGIYLLPGEETIFTRQEDWLEWEVQDASDSGFPDSWNGSVYFLICNGHCERDKRPMQCRTYPVAPHLTKEGEFILVIETLETKYHCPLIDNPKYQNDFSEEWMQNLYRSWAMLLNDPLIYDLVLMDSEYRIAMQNKLVQAYPKR